LPQGPFLVDATIRGSPEGGTRAQHVLNWNLRASRDFDVGWGRLTLAADVLNVLNNGDKIVESDLSGPQFNERPAVAIPPPRTLRLSARWSF
jgi:outer membrane receptor protein involved in Fe transport